MAKTPMIPDRRRQHYPGPDDRHLDNETVSVGRRGVRLARQALKQRRLRLGPGNDLASGDQAAGGPDRCPEPGS